ncbi:Cytosolic sulfotransferase 13 [Acorus calamus]|uniref:Cytosolic sulfotransferase 13 n=1 Tax=Acorus calamus TaxID=4465 RepID=A0AAV9FMG2_ACOCL|nr:Cytosolic sulfotransferase 13 [Acorus calamus]
MATNPSINSNIPTTKMEEEVRGADEKTEEKYAHIISTLPKKKSWGQELQRYQGFWYYPFFLDGVMSVQHNFKVRPSDVLKTTPIVEQFGPKQAEVTALEISSLRQMNK